MKKVKGGKSRAVHPVSEYVPVGIMTLADSLSPDDKQILSYLISFTSPSSSLHNHIIKNTTITTTTTTKQDQETQQHIPVFNCDCFSCYTSYWARWNISPNRLLIHHIIDAYEDHLASSSSSSSPANKKSYGREIRKKKKKKKKRTQRAVVSPSDSELTRSDSVVADNNNLDLSVMVYRAGDGMEVEKDLDDIDDDDDDEKGGGGSNIMNKFLTFIANKLWN